MKKSDTKVSVVYQCEIEELEVGHETLGGLLVDEVALAEDRKDGLPEAVGSVDAPLVLLVIVKKRNRRLHKHTDARRRAVVIIGQLDDHVGLGGAHLHEHDEYHGDGHADVVRGTFDEILGHSAAILHEEVLTGKYKLNSWKWLISKIITHMYHPVARPSRLDLADSAVSRTTRCYCRADSS